MGTSMYLVIGFDLRVFRQFTPDPALHRTAKGAKDWIKKQKGETVKYTYKEIHVASK